MLRIGLVGAGTGGINILKTLVSVSGIEVVGVCDKNHNAPGIIYAKEHNIPVFYDFTDILKIEGNKIVIEVTGNKKLKEDLEKHADDQTEIISSEVALLITNVVESREKITRKLEEEASELGVLAENLSLSIQETSALSISNSEKLNNTVDNLIKTARKNQDSINETNDIIKFIKNVATQTKMLGFNAAIEANQAGYEGRGFSVVANEIKKLADETGKSVARITHLIDDLNNATKETFSNVEEMKLQTNRFMEVQDSTSNTLINTVEKIEELSTLLINIQNNG